VPRPSREFHQSLAGALALESGSDRVREGESPPRLPGLRLTQHPLTGAVLVGKALESGDDAEPAVLELAGPAEDLITPEDLALAEQQAEAWLTGEGDSGLGSRPAIEPEVGGLLARWPR
jgi:type II secretory pathway component PulJ